MTFDTELGVFLKKLLVADEDGSAASRSKSRRSEEFPGQSPPQVLRNILSGSAPLLQAHCYRFYEAAAQNKMDH